MTVSQPVWYPTSSLAEAVAEVAKLFRQRFGRDPDGVWAAPGRVNVIGEHVDYNGGRCLPFALPQRTFVALSARKDDRIEVASAQADHGWSGSLAAVRPGSVGPWAAYAVGVPWALRQAGLHAPGFDAIVSGQVPLGAGLSSSAALECAVAVALDDLGGLGLAGSDAGRTRLAQACVVAENDIAGAPTGGMDQAAALRCTTGHALLLDCRDFSAVQVPFDLAAAGLELLVVDTRTRHRLVDGQYGSRRDVCKRAARLLGVPTLAEVAGTDLDDTLAMLPDGEHRRRVRHVVTEIARVDALAALLRAGSPRDAGPLLNAAHTSLRDDYEVSCAELDVAVEAARQAGALGARMTGGGFGGSAIALVEAGTAGRVADAVDAAFDRAGFTTPAFLTAVPSGSAGRVG